MKGLVRICLCVVSSAKLRLDFHPKFEASFASSIASDRDSEPRVLHSGGLKRSHSCSA